MLRFVGWILALLAAVVMVVFAINNDGAVAVDFWPVTGYSMPLYLVVFAGMFIGLTVGAVLTWLAGGRWRGRARQAERDIKMLKLELAESDKRRAEAADKAREAVLESRDLVPAASGEVTTTRGAA